MPNDPFSVWIAALLKHFQLPLLEGEPQKAVAFHNEGKPNVFVAGRDGNADFLCEAGMQSAPYMTDVLLSLLELNRCTGADMPVHVTMDRASGAVIVWARERMERLDASGAAAVIRRVREKADAVRAVLGKPEQRNISHANALSRMQRMMASSAQPGR